VDHRAGNRKPYGRCLAIAAAAVEAWAATEGRLALRGFDLEGTTLRRFLIVYEALLREGMDAETMEKFDRLLDEASDPSPARSNAERIARMRELGAEVG
jgi:hypothetical protein